MKLGYDGSYGRVAAFVREWKGAAYKDLSAFDFAASGIREALVRQLQRCVFLEATEHVVLIGGPGTGKSHVVTALGIQATNITASACASSQQSNWSTPWNRKKSKAKLARSPRRW